MAFCDVFGDSSVARILDHLAKYSARDFSMTELARDCDMSYRTIQRIFPIMVQKGIVAETRKIGKATMYTMNMQNETIRELHRVLVRNGGQPEDKPHHVAYI